MRYLVAIAALAGCNNAIPTSSGSGSGSAATGSAAKATEATVDASAPDACLPDDEDVYLVAGDPLRACAGKAKQCVGVAVATGAVAAAPFIEQPRDPEIPHAIIEDHGGKWAACFDGACKPLGKKARAAMVKLQEERAKKPPDPDAPEPSGTTDLAAVVIPAESGAEVYNVKKDRPMLSRGQMGLDGATPVGTALVTAWSPPETVVYTSAGKQIVELGDDSHAAMLDDKRWLLLSPYQELYVFDGPPKQVFHKLDLEPARRTATMQVDLAVLADKSVAVLMASPDAASLSHIDPERPAIIKRWPLTVCGKPAAK